MKHYNALQKGSNVTFFDKEYTFSKLKLAKVQLEKAIELFLEESDYVCSITLAGASEEILGNLLERKGEVPELKDFVMQCTEDSDIEEKHFAASANYFRNHCKHLMCESQVIINGWAVISMLNRAINNYHNLTGVETELMKKFNWEVNGT